MGKMVLTLIRMGLQNLRENKMERRGNKNKLNGNATIVGKMVTLKNTIKILSKNRNRKNVIVAASSSNTLSEVLNVSCTSTINKWIMDSGCSFHMCSNIEWF